MRLFILNILVISLISFNLINAQRNSTVIVPEVTAQPHFIGGTIGFGQNFQTGKMNVDCLNCTFTDGVKFNFIIGLFYETRAFNSGYVGMDLLFSTGGMNSNFTENENIIIDDPDANIYEKISVPFRHTAALSVQTLHAIPYFKFEPFEFMFAKLGFSANYVLTSDFTHNKELLKKQATLSNGVVYNIKLADNKTNIVTVQSGEYKELEKLYFAINPSIGFNIPFDQENSIIFSPWIMYSLPLGQMANIGEDFKLNSWHIMLSLMFNL